MQSDDERKLVAAAWTEAQVWAFHPTSPVGSIVPDPHLERSRRDINPAESSRTIMIPSSALRQPIATASLFVGWLHAIEQDPAGWAWPTATALFLRHLLTELTAEISDGATGLAVTS